MTEILIGIAVGFFAAFIKFAYNRGGKIIKEERDAHERITNAKTGDGDNDADRVAELQRIGKQWDRN